MKKLIALFLSLVFVLALVGWISYINAVEMAAHFLFTLSVIKRCNFRPIIWRRLQRFFIFKLLLLQFAYAPAKKMRDFKGNIPVGTRFSAGKSSVLYLCFRLTRERG